MRSRSLARASREPPRQVIGTWLFLRVLGLAHFSAFISLFTQVDGLLGANGVLPAADYLQRLQAQWGTDAVWWVPSVLWVDASDVALRAVALTGVALAVLFTAGVLERWLLAGLWLLYLSVCTVGQAFFAYQWDVLLLECSVVALLVASPRLFAGPKTRPPPPRLAHFALRLLLVKLIASSGWVKLASGDPSWAEGTAMLYHYETQPLPTWIGWWAHQLPRWWHRLEVVAVFLIQLGASWLALTRWRAWAFIPLAGLQVLIALTGNYCFFNLLTVGLCSVLLPDETWRRLLGGLGGAFEPPEQASPDSPTETSPGGQTDRRRAASAVRRWGATVVRAAVCFLVAVPFALTVVPGWVPRPLELLNGELRPLRSFNAYGLFAVMTTERVEIEIQGSQDGSQWRPYVFAAKPGPLDRAPAFVAPGQPRLDWQMWFAALGTASQNPWFTNLVRRLLEGSPEVLALLARDPFDGKPPRYVRAVRYRYRFTRWSDDGGAWWRREPAGDYFPVASLSERLAPNR